MVRFNIECDLPFSRQDFWRIRAAPSFLSFIVSDGLLKKMDASPVAYADAGWATRVQHYCPARVDCPDFIRAVIGDTMFAVDDHQRWNDDERPFQLQFNIKPSFLSNLSKTYGTLSVENFGPSDPIPNDEIEGVMQDIPNGLHSSDSADRLSSAEGSTDADGSDSSDGGDSSDNEKSDLEAAFLSSIHPSERSVHIVSGETRVSIMTVGWFIERAIVHNLKNFYTEYPSTVLRFRKKLYAEFADGDESIACSVVVDRFLEQEERKLKELQKAERAREWANNEELDVDISSVEGEDNWDDVE